MADHRVPSQEANPMVLANTYPHPYLAPHQLHGQVRRVAFLTATHRHCLTMCIVF